MKLHDIIFKLKNFLFTPLCSVCHESVDAPVALCPACMERYREALLWQCGACGKRLEECLCSDPILRRAGVKRMIKLFRYRPDHPEWAENRMLYRMKKDNPELLFCFLAGELSRPFLTLCRPDEDWVITYVPRTKLKERDNGYDQARCLAEEMGRATGIPFAPTLRRSRKHSLEQKHMPTHAARLQNANGSYLLLPSASVAGKRVLLVDDIVTSGASAATCAELLRHEGGAKEVVACAVAVVTHEKNPAYLYAEPRE